jgi:hypothetical protein
MHAAAAPLAADNNVRLAILFIGATPPAKPRFPGSGLAT